MKTRMLAFTSVFILAAVLGAAPARSQEGPASDADMESGPQYSAPASTRKVYEGVVSMKQKTIGSLMLIDTAGNNVSGWIRLGKFIQIDGGTVSEHSLEFRAGGNSYKIDERKGRIVYSGPDGSGDRIVSPLSPITGILKELLESDRFSGYDIARLDVNGRNRRFRVEEPSLWKHQGPPFESFRRTDELLQREITLWVSDPNKDSDAQVIEEPVGMDIPLKLPKQPKDKKK